MLAKILGSLYRKLPDFKGKGRLAAAFLAPFVRGKGHEVVVEMNSAGGGKLICNLDDLIPWNVYIYGHYKIEKNYESFMLKLLTKKSIAIDVGANIGYYTIQIGRSLGNSGMLYAFEPCQYQYDQLKKNVELNDLKNVSIIKKIVSEIPQPEMRIYFSGMENTGSSSTEIETDHYEDVECTTLDVFCESNQINAVDLIKIDVEGHELSVLHGMRAMLEKGLVTNIFLEVNEIALAEAGVSSRDIVEYLDAFAYRPYSIASGKAEKYQIGRSESLVYFHR